MEFTMTPEVPVINPVFIINGWTSHRAKVDWNGHTLTGDEYRAHLTDEDLVVWINKNAPAETVVKIHC